MAKTQTDVKIRVSLKSYDVKVIEQSARKIIDVAVRTGAIVSGPVPMPTRTSKYTVIRGPHIDKRSREQFEIRTHKRLIDIYNPTPKTVDDLSHLSLPAGVGVDIKM